MNATETGSKLASAALMFNWFEYTVFCSMLLFSLLIGVYYGWFKKQDTVAEYLLGGKKMGVFPVSMSLIFSHVSGVTLLGIPTEIYIFGTQYIAIYLCNVASLYLVNYFYLPVFYHLQLNSLYEYLELRFNKGTRTLASFIFALSLVLFIPVVIYVPALAFNQVTGVSVHIITPIVSLICVFYTSFGGLKAVVWTDTLQSAFTLGSVIFVVILGFLKIGSISEVFRINGESSRLELFNMDLSPFERNTFWSVVIGSTFFWLGQIAVHPGAVQRFIAVSSFKESKSVMFWSFIGFFVIKGLVTLVGLLMYANYHDCDPIATKAVQQSGQLLPYYVMEVAQQYPGLTGLFISGVLSAALSTMSAGLNTVAGTLYEDFVQFVLKGKRQSEATQAFMLKIIVLVIGLICICMVFVVEKLGSLFQMALSLLGVTNGALVGVFSLGIFIPRANAKGAMVGSIVSMVTMAVVISGAQYYKASGLLKFPGKLTSIDGCPADLLTSLPFNASERVQTFTGLGTPVVADPSVPLIFQVSYMYYVAFGTLIVLLVGVPVSYLTEAQDLTSLDPRLFTPCVRRFLPPTPAKPPAEEYTLVNSNPAPEDLKEPAKENITECISA
uniref:Sodium/solute symporter n=2 Tax=Homalodisca liturata TaxID=320908 RepID=A0A1B6JU79_9HEMI